MKKLLLIITLISFISCSESNLSKSKAIEEEKSKDEILNDFTEIVSNLRSEKITLISIIIDIPKDKTNSVIKEYLAKDSYLLRMEDPNYIEKIVDTIARKNNLSNKLTASIIFAYKYEMVTKNDIVDEYNSNQDY